MWGFANFFSRLRQKEKTIMMRDKVSRERVKLLHPKIRDEVAEVIEKIESTSFPPTIAIRLVSTLRTFEEQTALYEQGRTKPGKIVTNAKAGQSNHNYGLSFDFAMVYDKDGNGTYEILSWNVGEDFDNDKQKDWLEVVNGFKAAGYSWGGDWKSFKDYPHIEKTFGLSVKELFTRYNSKQFIPGTKYVAI